MIRSLDRVMDPEAEPGRGLTAWDYNAVLFAFDTPTADELDYKARTCGVPLPGEVLRAIDNPKTIRVRRRLQRLAIRRLRARGLSLPPRRMRQGIRGIPRAGHTPYRGRHPARQPRRHDRRLSGTDPPDDEEDPEPPSERRLTGDTGGAHRGTSHRQAGVRLIVVYLDHRRGCDGWRELADRLGVTDRTPDQWRHRQGYFRLYAVDRIACALGEHIDDIYPQVVVFAPFREPGWRCERCGPALLRRARECELCIEERQGGTVPAGAASAGEPA